MKNWGYIINGRNRITGTGTNDYNGQTTADNIYDAVQKAFEQELWPLSEADSPTVEEFQEMQDNHDSVNNLQVESDDNIFIIQIEEI